MPSIPSLSGDKVIASPALRLTTFSAVAALVVAGGSLFTDKWFDQLLGDNASASTRASVFIAVVGAWALIAVADVLARGYATAHGSRIVTAPAGLPMATRTKGTAVSGFTVAAIRVDGDGDSYLLVKAGQQPAWVPGGELAFDT
jgi:hypothetical protein